MTTNPFKRIIEGLDKIDEMKKSGVLDALQEQLQNQEEDEVWTTPLEEFFNSDELSNQVD